MTDTVQIGISNDQYDINGSDTTYQLAYGKYILQTKDDGFAGIKESSASQNNTIQVDGAVGSTGVAGRGVDGNICSL